MEYGIVQRSTINDLQLAVNNMLREGWVPLGGISHVYQQIGTSCGHWYTQALIRQWQVKA